jgi:O-acetyl-ADP-ribose deacetylase (regulator of RNase III)
VLNFGKTTDADCSVLINPANPQLSGVSKFPYFPRGGPVPQQQPTQYAHHIMGQVSQWGGMEVGEGMLFPASVIDGMVHLYGGWHLEMALQWYRLSGNKNGNEACPVGTAVRTTAGQDKLGEAYDSVIHTVPPFYRHVENPNDDPIELLRQCYQSALDKLEPDDRRVATALLGAGCRGFPLSEAISAATQATTDWCRQNDKHDVTVAFGLLEDKWCQEMIDLLLETSKGE